MDLHGDLLIAAFQPCWTSVGARTKMGFASRPSERGKWLSNCYGAATGFTLLELLVVIAVIALLAGLLAPTLSKAKTSAGRALCTSNQRQLLLALRLFVDDHGSYPLGMTMEGVGQHSRMWFNDLEDYSGAKWPQDALAAGRGGVFRCPGYHKVAKYYPALTPTNYPRGSYGYNFHGVMPMVAKNKAFGLGGNILVHSPERPGDISAIQENEVLRPSDMIAIGDAVIAGINRQPGLLGGDVDLSYGLRSPSILWGFLPPPKVGFQGFPPEETMIPAVKAMKARHMGFELISFCDGHVEAKAIREVFDLTRDGILKRWNNDNEPHRDVLPKNLW